MCKQNEAGTLGLALLGALLSLDQAAHPTSDHLAQRNADAVGKSWTGPARVYLDGDAVTNDDADAHRRGELTLTRDLYAALCTGRHVASYTLVQAAVVLLGTRAMGYRLPTRAVAVGLAITAGTHFAIDYQRRGVKLVAKLLKKQDYVDRIKVVREAGGEPDPYGPGTGTYEIDQALHRLCAILAALVTAWLSVRPTRRKR
jgi:hypothetical protein